MAEKSSFWSEFKTFIARGNVMDMAVGVVVGGAFTAIVNSLVGDIINPLIGKLQVQELNALAVQIWVNKLKISPSSGEPLTAATIKHTYHVLRGAMDKTVLAGIILRTPCTGIILPKGEKKACDLR